MTEQALFDVPNLDGLSVDRADYSRAADVLYSLSSYARHKARAMYYRENGRISEAIGEETEMQLIYANLPQWARW